MKQMSNNERIRKHMTCQTCRHSYPNDNGTPCCRVKMNKGKRRLVSQGQKGISIVLDDPNGTCGKFKEELWVKNHRKELMEAGG